MHQVVNFSALCAPTGSLILFDLLSNQKNGSPGLPSTVTPTANGETNQVAHKFHLHLLISPSLTCFCIAAASRSKTRERLTVRLCLQVPAPVTQANAAASAPAAVEEEPKEDGEEFEDLAAMLEHLGLSEYKTTFDEERIDVESFVRKIKVFFLFSTHP